VTVRDEEDKKTAIPKRDQPPWQQGSLAPYSITGAYQVRTNEQADFVLKLAVKTACVDDQEIASDKTTIDQVFVSSTRKLYDRPRNERIGLQRFT
jgi:hypothetical protein